MFKRLIYVMTFVLALSSTAHAAVYLWNGSAADGLWDTPANWAVTDSAWIWPNEEAVADPNLSDKLINADTLAINILNGDAVTRGSPLAIQGADGSTTVVLTLNNGSSLTVDGRLAIGGANDTRGQIDILGGSTLTILGDGSDLRVVDSDNTWGTVNIVDSTVDISDDLVVDQGEGHVNIGGSSTVNVDDLIIADANTSVGYLDISGTATVTLRDDFSVGKKGVGTVNISGDATLIIPDELYIANDGGSEGHMTISGNATVNIVDDLSVGDDGPGTCDISDNATVTIVDDIYVAHNVAKGAFESHMTISGNARVNCDDFIVANNAGLTGFLEISGNPTIGTHDDFIMNDDSGDLPSFSQVIMNGGTVVIGDQTYIGDDGVGGAEFIMNGGSWYSDDDIYVGEDLESIASLTINGGSMITGDRLKLGDSGGDDIGRVRIFMNGGLFQAEALNPIKITDSNIVYTGGQFRIGSNNVNEAEMQQLITDGTIVATGAYSIDTDGDYTVLSTLSPTASKFPSPADGAENVLIGTSLSWVPGDTADTHDVSFGTTNTPPSIGNQEAASYYPGPLKPNTTYYWQIDEVEADGTKHAGNIYSFTTGISNIAMRIRIKASSDDTETDINGNNNLGSGDLEIPYDGAPAPDKIQVIGLRFADVGIKKGTTITSAAVQFSEDDVNNKRHMSEVHLIIDGQLNPNPDTFADTDDSVADRQPRTAAMVEWDPPAWTAQHLEGPPARTSDVSSIIQELIDQDGWAEGNALVLIITDNPDNPSVGMREAESFDGAGGNAEQRPTLHLTIISDAATEPNPANGATDVPIIGTIISWWPGISAVSHDEYMGTSSPPPFIGKTTDITFDPGVLRPSTTYYWRVDAHKADSTIHAGEIWSFTTEPGEALQPDPADKTVGVDLDQILSWTPGITAATHDVYFGTSSPPAFIGNQTELNFNPAPLEFDTTYYWQINEVEADGTTTYTGDIWSFTTVLDIPITDPNLVLWWMFDESAGTAAVDQSGHNHYGAVNGATWVVDGKEGGALDFGGDGDHVINLDGSYLNGLDAITFAVWIKSDVTNTDKGFIIGQDPVGSDTHGMRYDKSGATGGGTDVLKIAVTSTGGEQQLEGSNGLQTTEWQHCVMVWSSGEELKFYVNGLLDTPTANSDATTGTTTGFEKLYVGKGGKDESATAGWDGMIDDLRIYDIALSAAEIEALAAPPEAWSPDPADGATEVPKSTTLSWLAGNTAASHDVYLSTDQQAVIDGTALIGNQAETSFSPSLDKGATYYWRVDEVEADGTTHTGAVWSFTVTSLGR